MNFWETYKGKLAPPGYMTVPDVFEVIGRTIYNAEHWGEDRWTGREAGYDLPLTEEEAERRTTTFRWMHRRASAGVLSFHTLHEGHIGQMHPVFWNCTEQVAFGRFENCKINVMGGGPIVVGESGPLSLEIIVDNASLLRTVESTSVGPDYGRDANATVESFLEQVNARKRAAAAADQPKPSQKKAVRTGATPEEARIQELAAALDEAGVAKRALRTEMIADRWNPEWGAAPTKENVWPYMKGGTKGAPKRTKRHA